MSATRRINDRPRERENPEPSEGTSQIPWYLLALVLGLVTWGVVYIVRAPTTRPQPAAMAHVAGADGSTNAVDGKGVFAARCQACHQTTGMGLPGVFPPLVDSHWVNDEPEMMVQILLHGLTGEIEVNGTRYAGMMPGFGHQLSDAEIAAVSTYVRQSWGNAADAIDVAFVAEQRTKTADRTTPWQGQKELEAAHP